MYELFARIATNPVEFGLSFSLIVIVLADVSLAVTSYSLPE